LNDQAVGEVRGSACLQFGATKKKLIKYKACVQPWMLTIPWVGVWNDYSSFFKYNDQTAEWKKWKQCLATQFGATKETN
jgi:hypothetical protein